MKSLQLLAVTIFGLGAVAAGAVSLSIDGQVGDEVILKVGQSAVVWVSSDDGVPYSAYVGFDEGTALPGTLDSPLVYTAAGNLASASPVSPPPITGYYLNAAGASPAPSAGVHFRLIFTAASEGKATLKLYDSTLSAVLQSVTIRVEGAAAGTGFTYQGRLLDEDKAASGLFDLRFEMFETPSGGSGIGGRVDLADVSVEDGYFTVRLDFGNVFGGQARWLQTSVRASGSEDEYTQLWPRQRLTAAPQATYAEAAGRAEHAVIASGVHWANVAGIPPAIANYVAPDVQTGFVPYYDGSRLVSSAIRSDSGRAAIGTNINTGRKLNVYTASDMFGLYSANARAGSETNYGILGEASGNTTESSIGVYGSSSSNSGRNFGIYGLANTASPGTNYGVYGSAFNSGTGSAYAGWFAGNVRITGILNQDGDLRIASDAGRRVAIGTDVTYVGRKLNLYTNADSYGLYSQNATTSGSRYAVYGHATGQTSGDSYGVFARSSSDSGRNYGVYGIATTPSAGTNYGVYGEASNSGTGSAYAGYFSGNVDIAGTLNKGRSLWIATDAGSGLGIGGSVFTNRKLHVYTDSQDYAIYSTNARTGSGTNHGIRGEAIGHTTNASYGVYGRSVSNSGINYGLYGSATAASTGSNYGIYAAALNSGSGAAYAGYFHGVTILLGDVGVGTTSIPTGRRINTNTGAFLSTGGVWTNSSSRERKENFEAVDGREILEALVRVPVSTWNYKDDDASVRHMGPMSQDLYAAFKLSGDDESISTVDTAGLSFAAIQGLYQVIEEKEAEIASVRQENESLRRVNEEIINRLAAIEARLETLASQ